MAKLTAQSVVPSPHSKRLILSYAPDWLLTIALAAAFFSLDRIDGYRRLFSLSDKSISYPYAEHERIPNAPLYIISILAPLVLMAVTNVFTVRTWWDFHNSTLGLLLASALTGAFTQAVKVTVGRPRPDLISRCRPPSGLVDPPFGLTYWQLCTQTDGMILRDGFKSFFSGHSSASFAGLGFLSFYLAGKLHLFDKRGHAGKAWVSLAPLMGALLVAISRTMDYRHHWQDVLVGSIVGLVFAFFSYRQYYPPLESPQSHQPYSPRIKREDLDNTTGNVETKDGHTGSIGRREQDRFMDPRQSEPLNGRTPSGTFPRDDPGSLEDLYERDRREERVNRMSDSA